MQHRKNISYTWYAAETEGVFCVRGMVLRGNVYSICLLFCNKFSRLSTDALYDSPQQYV